MRMFFKSLAVILMAVVLGLGASLYAQKPPGNRHLQMLPNEEEATYRFENMRVSKESGAPIALYRVNYPVAPADPLSMAQQYLKENASLLHIRPDLGDIRHTVTRETPGGFHVRFQQYVQGYPVYKGDMVVNLDRQNRVTFVMNSYKPLASLKDAQPRISLAEAKRIAKQYLNIPGSMQLEKQETVVYYNKRRTRLAHKITLVPAEALFGEWEVMVDAHSGEIFRVEDKALYDGGKRTSPTTGSGWVFDPDPLTRARAVYQPGGPFGDNNDNDTDSLTAHIVQVPLLEIDFDGSQYHLDGPYANIEDFEAPFEGEFSQADSNWHYTRSPQPFEAATVYYHIDKSMRYINETLGFNLMPFQYTGGVQVDPHGLSGDDNSHYISATGRIAWGEGGVDDSEDPDVILHELGHGLHDWLTNGSLSQVNGLSEGVGDYWAASYNRSTGYWTPFDPQYFWVFQWDGHNEFWPGRVTNYGGHYPEDLVGQVHTDGQMWSSTLMQIYEDIGRTATDSDLLEALAMTNSATNQEDAAQAFIQADINLFGGAHLSVIEYWFEQRGYNIVVPVPQIEHTPLSDTENLAGPYPVTATITASFPLAEVQLIYGTDGMFTDTLNMTANGNDFSADIPGTGVPTHYNYYIFAADTADLASTHPPNAPTNYHSFFAGPDTVPPMIVHTPLRDQAYQRWPAKVQATITDNLGVSSAVVEYSVNNGAITGSFNLIQTAGDVFEGFFDIDTTVVNLGDSVDYRIVAIDASAQANQSTHPESGFHRFAIVSSLGMVLIIDDDPTTNRLNFTGEKGASHRDPRLNPFGASASLMENTLNAAGYMVTVETPNITDPNTWDTYDLIISSSGINENSLSNTNYRNALIAYSISGGKFIIEGGEVGWTWRNDNQVMTHLLHSTDWNGDNEGALQLVNGQENHPIVTTPNLLPSLIPIIYTAFGSEDAMTPGDSYLIYRTTGEPTDAGISVYDDNGNPQSAQSVYYAFNFAQIADTSVAKALLENTINYLLTPETPANTAPSDFSLLQPADGDTVAVIDSIMFVWQAAVDAEGDPLNYTLHIFNAADTITVGNIADTSYLYTEVNLSIDTEYQWTVEASDGQLSTASSDTFRFRTPMVVNVDDLSKRIPKTFALLQNYPNPFNPVTVIRYQLAATGNVRVEIYNLLGEKLVTLVDKQQAAGSYTVQWNGRDKNGIPAASGIYLYRLRVTDISGKSATFSQVRKMVLMK